MINTNLKKMQSERGFTIVELLIVIVVIGILATIVIVAYNGITKRANATTAKANAVSVQKVADSFNAECPTTACSGLSGYPSLAQLTAYSANAASGATLPGGVVTQGTLVTSANADGKNIYYNPKGTAPNFTGACIGYWDQNANAVMYIGSGNAVVPAAGNSCS